MSSIKDLIAKKKQSIEASKASSLKTQKPLQGKNVYRILPAWREQTEEEKAEGAVAPFWHDFSMHWIKTEKGGKPAAVYLCTEKTFGVACDICASVEEAIASAKSEDMKDLIKESKSRQSYLLNVLHRDGKTPNQPILFEVGSTIFEQICEFIDEYGDITDLEDGMDLVINRTGSGFDTSYTLLPAKKSEPVDPSVMKHAFNLDAVVAQENASKQKAAMIALGKVTGIVSHAPALPKSSAKSAFGDDAEIDDAEFDEIDDAAMDAELEEAMTASSKKQDLDDFDELDELDELDDLLDVG